MNTLTSWFHNKFSLFTGFITNFHFSHLGFKKNSENRILGGKLKQTLGKKKDCHLVYFWSLGNLRFFWFHFVNLAIFWQKYIPKIYRFWQTFLKFWNLWVFFPKDFKLWELFFGFFFFLQWKIHINFFEHFCMKLSRLKWNFTVFMKLFYVFRQFHLFFSLFFA